MQHSTALHCNVFYLFLLWAKVLATTVHFKFHRLRALHWCVGTLNHSCINHCVELINSKFRYFISYCAEKNGASRQKCKTCQVRTGH